MALTKPYTNNKTEYEAFDYWSSIGCSYEAPRALYIWGLTIDPKWKEFKQSESLNSLSIKTKFGNKSVENIMMISDGTLHGTILLKQ